MSRRLTRVAAFAALVFSPLAAAHTGHGAASGLAAGLHHPVAGLDHLLAMLAVGLWAAQMGGRQLWTIPLAFVGAMALGAVAGIAGWAVPALELGIGGSVVLFGLLITLGARLSPALGALVVGSFALFHGVAHGLEMPASASGLAYGAGFVLSTLLLHAAGATAALLPRSTGVARLLRAGGALIAGGGLLLLGAA